MTQNNMTNEEIIEDFKIFFSQIGGVPTFDDIIGVVDEYFFEALQAKDQQHLEDKRRLIESVPNTFMDFHQMYLSPSQWKTEQFKKFKSIYGSL